jgi:glycosyltransferase involved in cell wall biosynthesis
MKPRKSLFIFRPTMGQGGADRVTLTLLRTLDRQEFELSLVLLRPEGEYMEDVPADVEVISLQAGSMWTAWPAATRLLQKRRPDIIFSTSSGTNMLASLAHLLARQRSRLVLSERNTVHHGGLTPKRRITVLLKRLLYGRADLVTAVSACLKDDIVEKIGLPAEKVSVVYNPVLEEPVLRLAQEPVAHPWFGGETPVILGTGRLVPQKDFVTLIRAFQLVRGQRPAKLLILGEGEKRPQLEALVNEMGLQDDVDMPGFDKNPFKYMARCTLFVQTPIHEGLGNVLIQAMACGAPVVSTDCPCGPSEIITEPGVDGILVGIGDVKTLADKMLYLLDNPAVRQKMGEKARCSVQRFKAEIVLERYYAAITNHCVS